MNKDTIRKEISEAKAHLDELERRLTDKPEYPDGTFGKFWDGIHGKSFGYLGKRQYSAEPFDRYGNSDLTGDSISWQHFEPITQAILPQPIEHDGGEYPGDGNDIVIVKYQKDYIDDDYAAGKAKYRTWKRVESYQLIKKA